MLEIGWPAGASEGLRALEIGSNWRSPASGPVLHGYAVLSGRPAAGPWAQRAKWPWARERIRAIVDEMSFARRSAKIMKRSYAKKRPEDWIRPKGISNQGTGPDTFGESLMEIRTPVLRKRCCPLDTARVPYTPPTARFTRPQRPYSSTPQELRSRHPARNPQECHTAGNPKMFQGP